MWVKAKLFDYYYKKSSSKDHVVFYSDPGGCAVQETLPGSLVGFWVNCVRDAALVTVSFETTSGLGTTSERTRQTRGAGYSPAQHHHLAGRWLCHPWWLICHVPPADGIAGEAGVGAEAAAPYEYGTGRGGVSKHST